MARTTTVLVVRFPARGEVDLTRPLPRTLNLQRAFLSFFLALPTGSPFSLGTTQPAGFPFPVGLTSPFGLDGPGAGLAAVASFTGRISITGDTDISESLTPLAISGGYGAGANIAVPFEESMTQAEIAQAVADAINGAAGLNATATAFADRVEVGGLITTSTGTSLLTRTVDDRRLIARNDDYYSEDSFVDLHLEAGVYFAAVTSTGTFR